MMFMFYNLPSALLLYWTVSQGLSIAQLYMQHRAAEKKAAAKAAAK
jgi:membrane protein insertase Oxa1/YidC/SpoIIIJ